MNKPLASAVLAACAACAVPAFADTVTYSSDDRATIYDVDPVTRTYVERQTVIYNRDGTVSAVYEPTSRAVSTAPSMDSAPVTFIDRTPVTPVAPQIDARSLPGVREADNELRSRIGNF